MLGVIVVPEGLETEAPIAGLAPIVRHLLALQSAGVSEVRLVGAGARVPLDPRVLVPVTRDGPLSEAAVILPADVTCHRLLPGRRARMSPGPLDVLRVGGEEASCFVAGAGRVEALVDAIRCAQSVDAKSRPLEAGEFVLPARDLRERRSAVRHHLRSLVKPTDGFVSRWLMRPVSLQITRVLSASSVTPNHVSLLCLALSLAGVALVAAPSPMWNAIGAGVFVAASMLDGVDGELARLRHQRTLLGEWLDTVADGIGIACFVGAVTWNVVRTNPSGPWLAVGLVGISSFAVVQGLQYYVLVRSGRRGSLQAIEWGHRTTGSKAWERFLGGFEFLFRMDLIAVAYPAFVWTRQLELLLVVHTVLAVPDALYLTRQVLRGRYVVRPDRAL